MRVYSEGSEPLTGGSYKLLYAGPSSPRTRLVVNPGTSRAEFVNVSDLGDNYAYGGDVLTKGSFVRIGGVDGKLVVQGAAVAAMGAALYFLNTLPGPTSGWAAK